MVVMPDAVIDQTVAGHHRLGLRRSGAAVHGRFGRGDRRRCPRAADAPADRSDEGVARRRRTRRSTTSARDLREGARAHRGWIDARATGSRRWREEGTPGLGASSVRRSWRSIATTRSSAKRCSGRCSRWSARTRSTRRSRSSTRAASNGTSIFTESGASVRRYRHEVEAGMVGVNIGVAAPVAFFPFSRVEGQLPRRFARARHRRSRGLPRKKTVTQPLLLDGSGHRLLLRRALRTARWAWTGATTTSRHQPASRE